MKRIAGLTLILLLAVCIAIPCSAEVVERTATIIELEGTAKVMMPDEGWTPAEVGMALTEGAVIRTDAGSFAVLYLEGTEATADVEVKEESELRLAELFEDQLDKSQTTLLDLVMGEILITSQKLRSEKSKFEVKTPTSIVGVRGTAFSISVEAIE